MDHGQDSDSPSNDGTTGNCCENTPGPYSLGQDIWPGVGKTVEEQGELATVLGKLMGSNGERRHWSGDLVPMMQDEIADLRAALDILEELNPVLAKEHLESGLDGAEYMSRRREWKRDLFRSWQRGDIPDQWPRPEDFGLPPR
ncbi:hypothetical protein [uncultured Salinicola sp.]|uniref:hypothetical protein n=1 Tax=uncultured Salinicola sp. TaxID=1193542 RepID=UPI002622B1AD|nr:hypothetical protein [uncultured Salinicola sp.]|tara:strand:- start:1557 stop:1985 length:429 start_codon:yes stop_codon:yes gene_type:complete